MKHYLVTIEFIYYVVSNTKTKQIYKEITSGIFLDLDDAIEDGNKILEKLENKYELCGKPKRFSKSTYGVYGPATLITNGGYLKIPFNFYIRIETLNYDSIDNVIQEAHNGMEEYLKYKYETTNK